MGLASQTMDQPEQALRDRVRDFLAGEIDAGTFVPRDNNWIVCNPAFSRRCGEEGFIAMTWPHRYGGGERPSRDRLVVCEEMLAAGAPLGFHWIADRQSGPQILRNGTEALREKVLPEIAAGRCAFAIGMSEPDSGSDLSSIRTSARKVDGGWVIDGAKVWTTNAHHADYMIVLCRTSPKSEDRYAGLSQLVVPVKAEGVSVRPIVNLAGWTEFNEVRFDGAFVPDDNLLGKGGDGWRLVTEELAFERSGPDRFLSTFITLKMLIEEIGRQPDSHRQAEVGRLVSRLVTVRSLSLSIADMLESGRPVMRAATMMKDMGTRLEQEIPEVARRLASSMPSPDGDALSRNLANAILNTPAFTIRGGTREILKGIIARELGVR
jgi:alkylation response protein AidB-like acyl-CoA dehydrogenase